jgi:hypothetical protein
MVRHASVVVVHTQDMSNAAGRVAWITIAPVKSMALVQVEHAVLETTGVAGDRAFAVLDEEDRLISGKRLGPLATIRPVYDPVACTLVLHFPDGTIAAGDVQLGPAYIAPFRTRPRAVHPVIGPWDEAVSAFAHQPSRLVALAITGDGGDRGPSATLVSTAALGVLARAGGEDEPLDGRRFRMTFGIDGIAAYAEDGWVGRDVRIGGAVVRVAGNVGRCAVTTQDPDTGYPTFDTLKILEDTRGSLETTEPLPFGVWSEILTPGPVRLGDAVDVVDAGGYP